MSDFDQLIAEALAPATINEWFWGSKAVPTAPAAPKAQYDPQILIVAQTLKRLGLNVNQIKDPKIQANMNQVFSWANQTLAPSLANQQQLHTQYKQQQEAQKAKQQADAWQKKQTAYAQPTEKMAQWQELLKAHQAKNPAPAPAPVDDDVDPATAANLEQLRANSPSVRKKQEAEKRAAAMRLRAANQAAGKERVAAGHRRAAYNREMAGMPAQGSIAGVMGQTTSESKFLQVGWLVVD
jgi:hypothetical protein